MLLAASISLRSAMPVDHGSKKILAIEKLEGKLESKCVRQISCG